jgi:predicted phage-related endonuclease
MITPADRERRRLYLGASDVPIILGLNPWVTPWDVWHGKVHGHTRKDTPATRIGSLLEDDVLELTNDHLDEPARASICSLDIEPAKLGVFIANFDGLGVYKKRPVVVEIKTTGITSDIDAGWGNAQGAYHPIDNQNVPYPVVVQVQTQLFVAGPRYQTALVGCLRGGRGFALYRVPRDEELISRIIPQALEWWRRYVVTRDEPENPKAKKETARETEPIGV